jgi:8-oxo-dGTP diphosphatase
MEHTSEGRLKIRAAAFLIVRDGDKILLHKRKNSGHQDGNYGLPSGHLDGNETVQQAAIREAKEEAGIDVDIMDVSVVHVQHNNQELEYFNFFCTASKWSGEPRNAEPEHCAEVSWYPIHDLPENTIGYIRDVLMKVEEGIFYSNWGWNK